MKFTLTDSSLLILGLEFSGSRLNVIFRDFKNIFMPDKRDCGAVAVVLNDG
jgi:hypothetical protein